jgi:light-regulated signal transduction histidine kinase (bacteriophytochrome)
MLDEKGIEYLSSMQKASQRMRTLIQDLLVFSQVNKEALTFKDVDLNEIANNALSDFEIAIEEKGAVLTIQPLPVIKGDKRMMQQLFENIISNALKYSKKDLAPRISISCEKENGNIRLAFSDNGIGFDEKYLPQMFTLFQRLHTLENYEGTGLGLAICRKIVELHQGEIRASAREGEGATIYVSFPENIIV